jgi:hypothetical protein
MNLIDHFVCLFALLSIILNWTSGVEVDAEQTNDTAELHRLVDELTRQLNASETSRLDLEKKCGISTNALPGLANYWPVKNGVMTDVVGGVNATSSYPEFTADRFGNANEAALVVGDASSWKLPNGVYLSRDFTITAWIKNLDCSGWNNIGLFKKLAF